MTLPADPVLTREEVAKRDGFDLLSFESLIEWFREPGVKIYRDTGASRRHYDADQVAWSLESLRAWLPLLVKAAERTQNIIARAEQHPYHTDSCEECAIHKATLAAINAVPSLLAAEEARTQEIARLTKEVAELRQALDDSQAHIEAVDAELGAGGICDGPFLVGMIRALKQQLATDARFSRAAIEGRLTPAVLEEAFFEAEIPNADGSGSLIPNTKRMLPVLLAAVCGE